MYEVKEMVFHRKRSAGEEDLARMAVKPATQTTGGEGA
jgi:hypothetical protein